MELLSKEDINFIANRCGFDSVISWSIEDLSAQVIGYLGDHLKLNVVVVGTDEKHLDLKLFVKCMPRFDKWKSKYLKELIFFKKEYIMLNKLFKEFPNRTGLRQWRPNSLLIREDLFVFEDVTEQSYEMPNYLETIDSEDLVATVKAMARFHSDSYVYEERKSKELGRKYSIWEDFKDFLQEPSKGQDWRDTGRNAVIDYLKEFSSHKTKPDFNKKVETVIPFLFDNALNLMKPNSCLRNAVIHRDLWTNNIFIKRQHGSSHGLLVDFQTVLYSSPMLDLSSFMYFNTSKLFRNKYTREIIQIYHETMSEELKAADIDISNLFDVTTLNRMYEDSITFGITQAALIVPIVAMTTEKRQEIFCDPETAVRANVVSRSEEFIEIARENKDYHDRVIELFDEIVERYIFTSIEQGT